MSDETKRRFLSPDEVDQVVRAMLDVVSGKPDLSVAIAGGIALQIYGSDKPTTDVDFLSNWTLGPQDAFQIQGPLSFGGLTYNLGDIPVDLIVRNDGYRKLYEEALENVVDYMGVPVVTPEYLAAMKFSAGRPKDIVAVAWLLGQKDLLDVEKVGDILRRTLGGQVAGDLWKRAVEKLTSSIEHARKKKKD